MVTASLRSLNNTEVLNLEVAECMRPKYNSVEFHDVVSESREGAADLAIAALAHGDFPFLAVVVGESLER